MKKEMVNHPLHYNVGKIEVIHIIEAAIDPLRNRPAESFCIGTAIKYLSRYSKKAQTPEGEIEDLEKAKWYIDRVIEIIKQKSCGMEPTEAMNPWPHINQIHSSGTIQKNDYPYNGPTPTIKYGDQV